MKKALLLFLSVFALVSCSNDDSPVATNPENPENPENPQPNPNLLTSVVFFPENATLKTTWNFDESGYLTSITDPNGTVSRTFAYDANHNLTSATYQGQTYTFTYNASNRVTSINGAPIQFDAQTNTYFVVFGEPDLVSEDVNLYKRVWKINADSLLETETDMVASAMWGLEQKQTATAYYTGGNLTHVRDNDMSVRYYTFDQHPNPLRNATLPISRAMSLITENSVDFYLKFIDGAYVSTNNVLTQHYDPLDPESHEYEYTYNALGRPETVVRTDYYLGQFDAQFAYAHYHYQGDSQ